MALRGKKPESIAKRLKLFLYGPAGVGKTTAAIQFPKPYIIDGERGAENYGQLIEAAGGALYQTVDIGDVISEVKALLTEKHEYRTLVLDPITTVYNDLLEKCEAKVGSEFGRHYGEANKTMKRLANLLMSLDMNVIVTAHGKKEYGPNMVVVGQTFDGWRQLDYMFDLVIELYRSGKGKQVRRMGRVVKSRIATFADGDEFEWSYEAIKNRYDAAIMEREAQAVALATDEQIAEINRLLSIVRLPDGTVQKWFDKAGVDTWDDMPQEVIGKCIDYLKGKLAGLESVGTNGDR